MSTVTISAQDVNKLRQMTGAGMMDCKKALVEAEGDFEKAIDNLRKKGQKVSASRADRVTTEGTVVVKTINNGTEGIVLALNCETDFVAKNSDFVGFAEKAMKVAIDNNAADIDSLLAMSLDGRTISDHILEMVGKIGEKIEISYYERVKGDQVVPYLHSNCKIGVLVALKGTNGGDFTDAGKDVAMQIAAMRPVALDKDDVSQELIERELEIGREQAKAEGKPEAMLEKIAQGKLNRFFKDNTLLNQDFVKDSSKTVAAFLDSVNKGMTVSSFKRIGIGA
jgi:elongation factor Ts